MKKKQKTNLTLLAAGVNGLAEMYAELTARCSTLEGEVHYLRDKLEAQSKRIDEANAKLQALSTTDGAIADEVMQEYFYGKRGGADV